MRAPNTITVRCDGPGHVRGKVATIAICDRDERGVWSDRRERSRTRSFHARADSSTSMRCNLCRRELPSWADVRPVLFPVLNRLAAAGRFDVTLAELIENLPNRPRGAGALS
jgi:hypothetical protein